MTKIEIDENEYVWMGGDAELCHTFRHFPTVLGAMLSVAAEAGAQQVGEILDEIAVTPRESLGNLEPSGLMPEFGSFIFSELSEFDAIYRTLLHAQMMFACHDCRAPTREEVLVGMLRGAIAAAARNLYPSKSADANGGPGEIFAIDLNVRNREKATGADIAFIFCFQIDGVWGWVPVCFQAKRVNPRLGSGRVVIKRTNKTDDEGRHQYQQLRETSAAGCSASYLFFNNDEERPLYRSWLPLAKDVEHFEPDAQLTTNLEEDCIDLAHYVLWTMVNKRRSFDGEASIADIEATLNLLRVKGCGHIVAMSANTRFIDLIRRAGLAMANHWIEVPSPEFQQHNSAPVSLSRAFTGNNIYSQWRTMQRTAREGTELEDVISTSRLFKP